MQITRREAMAGMLATGAALAAGRPKGPLVESHVHLFSNDLKRFPLAPDAPYKPEPLPVEDYVRFATAAGIDRAVIVSPEPYQDDYRYLEYCFTKEPTSGFFKGVCLFDPASRDGGDKLAALVGQNPGRIAGLRIHEMHKPGTAPSIGGPIKDRDLRSSAMRTMWRRVQQLHIAIEMHFLPHHAPQIGELAAQFPAVPVILDHLGRVGQGSAEDFSAVLKLAKFPQVYMKYSGVGYSSKEQFPFADVKPMVRRIFDAFGPDRMMWGYFGHDLAGFNKEVELFDIMFERASEADREKIRGGTALKFFGWDRQPGR